MAATAQTPAPDVVRFFKALADETRLTIVRLLALTDLRAGELVHRLRVPANAVSYHLKQLRALGLLRDRRSSLDARDVYYSVDLPRLRALYEAAGGALHPGLAPDDGVARAASTFDRSLRVLFLCTHNSARSQLAEGILRRLAGDQAVAYSAGSQPAHVHPMTSRVLEELGLEPAQFTSKAMELFLDQTFDYVITVCDRVQDSCPTFPDDPHEIHWSLPDPAAVEDEEQRWQAFCRVRHELETRIQYLLSLPHPATGQRLGITPHAGSRQRSS